MNYVVVLDYASVIRLPKYGKRKLLWREAENHMCVLKKNFFVWRIFFSTKYDDEWLCIEVMTNEAFLTMNEDMTTVNIFPFKIEYYVTTNNCK